MILFSVFTLLLTAGCGNADVSVTGFKLSILGKQLPGVELSSQVTVLNASGITLNARVQPVPYQVLSSSGITLTTGVVQ